MTRFILLLLFACCTLHAQPTTKPEFEVTSIKPSPPPDGRGMRIGCQGGPESKDPGLYTCQNMDLRNFVGMAYGMSYYQLSTLDWMNTARFDLRAKVPEGATKDDLKVMVQNMLADRFKFAIHHEAREIQKYDLVVAKNGPKFKEGAETVKDDAAADPPPTPGPRPRDKDGYPIISTKRPGMAMAFNKARMYDPAMTMEVLASRIGGQMGKPVTDATGLTGKYEISLYWSTESVLAAPENRSSDDMTGPTLQQALQDQLGLRLEAKKGTIDFLVVDHMEKTPTDN